MNNEEKILELLMEMKQEQFSIRREILGVKQEILRMYNKLDNIKGQQEDIKSIFEVIQDIPPMKEILMEHELTLRRMRARE